MVCRLALRLLRLFATGSLAGTQVQRIALEAWADRRDDELLKRLAKAGGRGRHTGNIARDLLKAAELGGLSSACTWGCH